MSRSSCYNALLVMAWVINCWPSPRLTRLVLRRACLPTQQMAPDKVNKAALTLPKLGPSPNITTHRTKWPGLGWSLLLLLGQICHLRPCLPLLTPARHVGVVVSFPHPWQRSPVFPSSTESQGSQVLVSSMATVMVNMIGCYQIPVSSGPFQPLGV